MRRWGPVLLYVAGITFLSHRPFLAPPLDAPDWIPHFIEFAGLGALVARAIAGSGAGLTAPRAAWGAAGCALFGLLDEAHQSFVPGRTADLRDATVDAAGAATLIAAWALVAARRRSTPGGGVDRGAAAEGEEIPIRIFGRKDCHLCDEAEATLREASAAYRIRIEKIDVDDDEDLRGLYGGEVPVVTIAGRRLFKHRVDPVRLRKILDSIQRRSHP